MAPYAPGLSDYPVQNAYTRDLRAAAAERYLTGLMSLWAGQAVHLGRVIPAAELVRRTAEAAERIIGESGTA